MKYTYTLDIYAPIAKVFSLVDDDKNLKKWIDGLEETIFPEGYDRAKTVGTKFKQRIKEGSQVNEYDGEVIAYEKPHHLAILLGNRRFTIKVDYRFTSDGARTRLEYQAEMLRAGWFVSLMSKLFSGFTKRILDRQMKKLKELAESSDNTFQTSAGVMATAK